MKLKKLVIQNFMSYLKATVYLADRGLVSVEGVTTDKDGADSNGSGKSTLINAILWCCYDDPGKDLDSVDDVVNSKANKDCMVEAHWFDEQNSANYVIARYRKHSKYKNAVVVYRVNDDGTFVDISKGTNPATQVEINKILGCDKTTFEAYCFARQGAAPDIPGMTDKELKELLEKTLPFDNLTNLYKIAAKNRDAQIAAISAAAYDYDKTTARLEDVRADMVATLASIKEWDDAKGTRVQEIKTDITARRAKVFWTREQLKPQDKIDEALTKYRQLVKGYNDQPRQRYLAKYAIAYRAKVDAKKSLDDQEAHCRMCKRPFEDHAQATAVLTDNLNKAQAEVNELLKQEEPFAAKLVEHRNNEERLQKLEELNSAQQVKLRQIELIEAEIVALERRLEEPEENPHVAAYDRLATRFNALELDASMMAQDLAMEKEKLPVLEAVAETFSPKGVRYHILEQVTPKLTQQTNYYLSQLTDGKMRANWSTVTKLKSGDYKEKFSIKVEGDGFKGYGSLSGGEQRKVKLACFFALQDMIAERATKSIDFWCGDEIDTALDAAGMERLMNVLHEKTASKSTILVISHNVLREWIPNYASVKKVNGVSEITGFLSE